MNEGFSEVMTSSFALKGDVTIEKPLATDKSHLRTDLAENIREALDRNLKNLPLLGTSEVKIFEMGKVFPAVAEAVAGIPKGGERTSLSLGIAQPKGCKGKKVNEEVRAVRDGLVAALGVPVGTVCTIDDTGGIILLSGKPIGEINRVDGILELNLDSLVAGLPEPRAWDISIPTERVTTYSPISPFPFIVRDIAFFVPPGTSPEKIEGVIKKEAGSLARRVSLFDRFEKNGKTSFAFRIVFQADDRTLTDEEANKIMEKVSKALISKFKVVVR